MSKKHINYTSTVHWEVRKSYENHMLSANLAQVAYVNGKITGISPFLWYGVSQRTTRMTVFFKENVIWYSTKDKPKTVYSNWNLTMKSVPHTETLSITFQLDDYIEVSDDDPDCPNSAAKETYVPDDNDFKPHRFSQVDLNDFVRDLFLSKDKSQLLAARLNKKNMIKQGFRITYFRQRNLVLQTCLSVDGPLWFWVVLMDFSNVYH